ncbi:universal stress protein [Paraburkholderia sp. GAS32]|uniref:universal stress protein n=1 Tax=Paraburkholderia sp. GAS32 TaxID=3035129 RepID=UPI003D1F3A0B
MEGACNQGTGIPRIELLDPVGSESSFSERLGLRFYSATENSLKRQETCVVLEYLIGQRCCGKGRTAATPFIARFEDPMPDHYNLLVYYDGSPESRSALLRVTRLGYALTATVHVLSVVDIGSAVGCSVGYLSDMACLQMEGAAKQVLKEALDHLRASGTVARGYVAAGNVVDSMARYAGLLNADLLVLGHRNPRGLARWWSQPSNHAELVKRAAGRAVITVPLD